MLAHEVDRGAVDWARLASVWWHQALALHRENGDLAGETMMLGNLGFLDL
jgi:hypothetical protein